MKKLFIVLAVASLGFVACNNSSSEDEAKRVADSTRIADSTAAAQKMEQDKMMQDTSNKMMGDTTHK